jgi:hypothetical protein
MEKDIYGFIKKLSTSQLKQLSKEIGIEFNLRKTAILNKLKEDNSLDGEVWKCIPKHEGYEVSNLGRVKSLSRVVYDKKGRPRTINGCILNPEKTIDGYNRVGLSLNNSIKRIKVHQLVAISFLNHTPCGYKYVINHKNFVRNDNRVENLEIVTQRENSNRKHIKSTSEYTGVCWASSRGKWIASIRIDQKKLHLGSFDNEQEASKFYDLALKSIVNNEPIKVKRIHNKQHSSLNLIITPQL